MKISVVMPLFNKEKTILNSICSVLNQTILPEEILVIDDGSTDTSSELVNSIKNPLVRLISKENGGVSSARNTGIEAATGDWIALLDSDDLWDLEFIEKMRILHSKFPQANVLASAYRFQYFSGAIIDAKVKNLSFAEDQGLLDRYFSVAANSHPPICSSAVLVRKDAFVEIGGFPTGLKSGEDLVTWAKLAIRNKIAYHQKSLATYVHQIENLNSSSYREELIDPVGDSLKAEVPLVNKDQRTDYFTYLARMYKNKGISLLQNGQNRIARAKFLDSWRFSSERLKLLVLLGISSLPVPLSKKIIYKIYTDN